MHTNRRLFTELARFTGVGVETRAGNAHTVAVQFLKFLQDECGDDEKAFDLMMKAWFRSVKDNDFGKFVRTYRKYSKQED